MIFIPLFFSTDRTKINYFLIRTYNKNIINNNLLHNMIRNLTLPVIIIFFTLLFFPVKNFAQNASDKDKIKALIDSSSVKGKLLEESIKILEYALTISDKSNLQPDKANVLHNLGITFCDLGEYSKSLNYLFEELQLREKHPDWNILLLENNYSTIGEAFRAIGTYDLALENLNKALNLSVKNKDENGKANIDNRLAAVYHEMSYKEFDTSFSFKATEFANKPNETAVKNNDTDLYLSNLNIIGATYNYRNDKKSALQYYLLALNIADKFNNYADKPNIMNNIASLYNQMGDYNKAIEYALQSHIISDKSGIKVYRLESARCLIKSYINTGDFIKACDYYEEASGLALDMYSVKKAAEISGLNKKFQDELKNQEENKNITKKFMFGSLFLLVIIFVGAGFYLKHRNQVKLNKELSAKNELISSQKEQLAQSNAAKDKFFSILSHDLKNPINGLLGFSNILENDFDNINESEKKEYIGYIKSSSDSLNKLIDKTLMWSRLQTGKIEVYKEKINLPEIVSNVIELQKVNAIRKGIILENNITGNLSVNADKYIVDTVVRNLVDNAIKFTEAGGKIAVGDEIIENKVVVSITDTGVGMNEQQMQKLFRIGEKVVSQGTDKEEGTGLGLILCKDMLILMGSDLFVDSKPAKGSRFYFKLSLIS